MRQPRDAFTTLNGLFSAELMAGAQSLVDTVINALLGQSWGVLNPIRNGLVDVVVFVAQAMVNSIFPGAPGSLDYLVTGPESLADFAGNTATTLVAMQEQRRWIQYNYIPDVSSADQSLSWQLYWNDYNYAASLYYAALNALYASINNVYGYIGQETGYLTRLISTVEDVALGYTKSVYNALEQQISAVIVAFNNEITRLRADLVNYVNSVRDALTSHINTVRLELLAGIAAATAYITLVFVPGAIAAFKLEQTAEIAAGMDVLYPVAAASIDKTALQLAPTLPLVSARALDVPPEAIPGIGGMAEALTAAAVFESAVSSNACAPMWTKLHEFADDTAELDGVVATVLLAGLVTAMTVEPQGTATVIADAIAGPLNEIGVQALSLIGLG